MTPESGFTSRFVSASDGLKLHYRDYGPLAATALPVICLPGLARTAALALVALGQFQHAVSRIRAPVEDHVLAGLAQFRLDAL